MSDQAEAYRVGDRTAKNTKSSIQDDEGIPDQAAEPQRRSAAARMRGNQQSVQQRPLPHKEASEECMRDQGISYVIWASRVEHYNWSTNAQNHKHGIT